ncbi:Gephyrin [Hondaea fermentalgiana]|uniref:molybdopterin molybdotransferase n=1 Tax=Hondaea fermentalgiana TaxID=2315210 RepID=A0A2R5GRG1_9STRA|nr:Gephyrin [Hondaea fermentalgiana]|eukprot:GBG30931.1 Gephyrin [Hondaea fermentalgiana]
MESLDATTRRDLHASAFDSLVDHLQKNTSVQNIDMMTISGFCRNCLSKWIFRGARDLGLDITYEQALEDVYRMPYGDWKKQYQTKASPEKMAALDASKEIHAQHPGLDFKISASAQEGAPARPAVATSAPTGPIMSDVCCQDPMEPSGRSAEVVIKNLKCWAPTGEAKETVTLRLGILTISDRASKGVYKDESGPEIAKCVTLFANEFSLVKLAVEPTLKLVPDEKPDIIAALRELAGTCNLILTTGGTGLSPRDVTPEATLEVVQREVAAGAMSKLFKSGKTTLAGRFAELSGTSRLPDSILSKRDGMKEIRAELDGLLGVFKYWAKAIEAVHEANKRAHLVFHFPEMSFACKDGVHGPNVDDTQILSRLQNARSCIKRKIGLLSAIEKQVGELQGLLATRDRLKRRYEDGQRKVSNGMEKIKKLKDEYEEAAWRYFDALTEAEASMDFVVEESKGNGGSGLARAEICTLRLVQMKMFGHCLKYSQSCFEEQAD